MNNRYVAAITSSDAMKKLTREDSVPSVVRATPYPPHRAANPIIVKKNLDFGSPSPLCCFPSSCTGVVIYIL